MTRRVPVRDVLAFLGVDPGQLLDALRAEGLFETDHLPPEQAEELRVATVLMEDLGVNAAGVEVILHLRRRLATLEGRSISALRRALEHRGP